MYPFTTPPVEKLPDSDMSPRQESTTAPAFSSSTSAVSEKEGPSEDRMRRLTIRGIRDAESWRLVNGREFRAPLVSRWRSLSIQLQTVLHNLLERQTRGESLPPDDLVILENTRLLETFSLEIREALNSLRGPGVLREGNNVLPRSYSVAVSFLETVELNIAEQDLFRYLEGIQQVEGLLMSEVWVLKPMLELALLEQITNHSERFRSHRETAHGEESPADNRVTGFVPKAFQALRGLQEIDWTEFFDQNNVAERALRRDPSGVYAKMDDTSRQMYRKAVEELARQSLFSEEEVAKQSVFLAIRANSRARKQDLRSLNRKTHVGYYLLGGGLQVLKRRLGCTPPWKQRLLDMVLEWPEVFYVVGVEVMTLGFVFFLLYHLGIVIPLVPGLLLLIPASHAAVGIVNRLTSILVPPRRLPKLDFSEGIPLECTTLVAVPCLLLSEAEVRRNVQALEIRYLGNRDPNLHFALLTDSPDASERFDEHDELVGTCSTLIDELNQKYARDEHGSFLHLHRHRVYNPSEGSWMGWERKRGKMMDLNSLLLGTFDSFPVKAGDLSALPHVRYVITLDSDTKLPPGTAHRLVGAMAHPLNQAVVDPKTNTVVEGYGILQPRVSVSIESSRHSRLASIYSGQTGFDIYTQAISDVYQDLFGEGSFTGKGIYEVETFQRVLGKRFPTNALLSHDLIEGAYARAGLASDIVVIDDYPSHFSAYSRRLHRWVRGDWQIMQWLLPSVPDYYGRRVPNPLTFISRWKIFDNMRRSVNDIGLFLLLILGCAILPGGPVYWTLVTLGLLLMPTYSQLLFALLQIRKGQNWSGFLRERANELLSGHLHVFVMIVFLPHQALVMLDAIVRTLNRLIVTKSKLLQWETAAESELGTKKSLVETYLAFTPALSLATAVFLAWVRPDALFIASPILVLWLLPDFFTDWVNRQPVDRTSQLTPERERFFRLAGLRTWRYFREFSNAENHWLIPDNVQEAPASVALRLSSTNLGLLFNAHLAAHELGHLTLGEYGEAVERTLNSARQMPRHNGHFYNWYDLQTRQPLEPRYASTVDSGNLAASLWTMKQSCIGLPSQPLFSKALWQGIRDHIQLLSEYSQDLSVPAEALVGIRELAAFAEPLQDDACSWIGALAWLEQQIQRIERTLGASATNPTRRDTPVAPDLAWWAGETASRLRGIRDQVENLIPWGLPEYLPFFSDVAPIEGITLASLPSAVRAVESRVDEILNNPQAGETERGAARLLRRRLPFSVANASRLAQVLRQVAKDADGLVDDMDFRFLYNPKKKMFSTGYNVGAGQLDPSHYDLMASEARTAVFIAAAKGEVNQEAWFHLGRPFTAAFGERVLLSWSGTMFEYLMPALWMRSLPDTIMNETLLAAVRCQQAYGRKNDIPWGISEAAFSERNSEGIYIYRAFGVPSLALDPHAPENLVVCPYASFLALLVEGEAPYRNLDAMSKMGCLGSLGFYESCDFTPMQKPENGNFEIIQCWMAHHQGMSLLALGNFLNKSSIQKWFHREPRVMAAELILHEKVALSVPVKSDSRSSDREHSARRLLRPKPRSASMTNA